MAANSLPAKLRMLPIDRTLTSKVWADISAKLGLGALNHGVFGGSEGTWAAGSTGQFQESVDPSTGVSIAKTSRVSLRRALVRQEWTTCTRRWPQ